MSTAPKHPPFDSNRAWGDAASLVSANRDILIALAGVFFVLPALAIATFAPPPDQQSIESIEALMAVLAEYYRSSAIYLIAAALVQMVGSLSMLALFTDARRPTVKEAISTALRFTPTAIAAQLILGTAIGAMVLLPVLLGGATKSPGFTLLSLLAAFGLGLWAVLRLALVSPTIVAEQQANPVRAMQRSWALTEGNVLRLLAFFVLIALGFLVVALVCEGAIKLVLAFALEAKSADIVADLAVTLVQSAMSVYLVAITAACHSQLAGPSMQSTVDKFE